MRQRGRFAKKLSTPSRASFLRSTTFPCSSRPTRWNTRLPISRPMIFADMIWVSVQWLTSTAEYAAPIAAVYIPSVKTRRDAFSSLNVWRRSIQTQGGASREEKSTGITADTEADRGVDFGQGDSGAGAKRA